MSFWTKKQLAVETSVVAESPQENEIFSPPKIVIDPSYLDARVIIAAKVRFIGNLFYDCMARIEGRFSGVFSSTSVLIVAEKAVIRGEVSVRALIVEGVVEGPITASDSIEILPGARVHGSLLAKTIIVHEGALVDGTCTVGFPCSARIPEILTDSEVADFQRMQDGAEEQLRAASNG